MSTSRSMSRLLRSSYQTLSRPSNSMPSSHQSLLLHSASAWRPATPLCSSSLSSARRSFFSRTAAAADNQQQSNASTSQQQSNEPQSNSTASSTPGNNNQQTSASSSSSTQSAASNGQTASTSTTAGSDSAATQQSQQQLTQLQQQLTTAQTQQKETYDRLLRTAAEMENLRRTTRIDVDNARKYATTGFAKSLLEVADTLELAGKSARDALTSGVISDGQKAKEVVQSLLEGVEMTERVLGKVLSDQGIVKVDAMGLKFNPHEHHGLFEVDGEEGQEAGTVAHVMKQGYKIHDRILRAAQVGTVKAKKSS